jgi:hypothetical protein
MLIKSGNPDHVDELGNKYWYDKSLTEYAQERRGAQKGLPGVLAWLVERHDGQRRRVLSKDGQVFHESLSIEAIAAHIDVIRFIAQSEGRRKEPEVGLEPTA